MNDQWAWWVAALLAKQAHKPIPESPDREQVDGAYPPMSGYFRRRYSDRRTNTGGWEAVAFWRDDAGELHCERSRFRVPETMAELGELFAACAREPVAYEDYCAVVFDAKPWPDEIPPQAAGSQPGHNNPPADEPGAEAAPLTEDRSLAKQIEALEKQVRAWLEKIGGKPTTRAEADLIANYATEFGKFQQEAVKFHKAEKAPVLEVGRAIDAKWFGLRDNAALLRGKLLDIGNVYIAAEQKRLADEARATAKEAGAPEPTAPPPRVRIGTTKTVSQRGRTVFDITDIKALALHFCAMERVPAEFVEGCQKAVNRLAPVMTDIPGIERRTETKAA